MSHCNDASCICWSSCLTVRVEGGSAPEAEAGVWEEGGGPQGPAGRAGHRVPQHQTLHCAAVHGLGPSCRTVLVPSEKTKECVSSPFKSLSQLRSRVWGRGGKKPAFAPALCFPRLPVPPFRPPPSLLPPGYGLESCLE